MLRHEREVRAWLRRAGVQGADADDVIQEAYFRFSRLTETEAIHNPRAYFYTTARSILRETVRRSRVVRIDALSDLAGEHMPDPAPGAERIVGARQELDRLAGILAALPERCREIFTLRKVQGLSQRDVAKKLGVTENVVEKQTARGLKLVLQALTDSEATPETETDKDQDAQQQFG